MMAAINLMSMVVTVGMFARMLWRTMKNNNDPATVGDVFVAMAVLTALLGIAWSGGPK